MPAGRPTVFTDEIAARICEEIADGRSLRSIVANDDGMPARSTVFKWLSENKQFSDLYARAKDAQADVLFEEILDIADEATTTVKSLGDGDEVVVFDNVAVQRNRLRVDARKWMAGKLRPKKYGDKLEIAGDPDAPVKIETIKRVIVDPAK